MIERLNTPTQVTKWSVKNLSLLEVLQIINHTTVFKLVLEKAEEPEIKLPTSAGSWKKQESSRKTYFCFIDLAKAFDCVDHNKLWKILKEMGIPDHLTCLLRNYMHVRKQQLETDMEKQTGSKLGKEYVKAVYCHPAYLTYMQSTPCEMLH